MQSHPAKRRTLLRAAARPAGGGQRRRHSLWSGRAPGHPFGLEGRDRPLAFRLLHVIEFADNGDIRRENVWVDLGAILRQLPAAG